MNFPEPFMSNIRQAFGEAGEKYLANLPVLIAKACAHWELREVQAVPNLSYNFVAFARQKGTDVVLKIGVPNPELTSEMNTLKLFGGEGACRLLDCVEEKGFLLIERLQPGRILADSKNDDQRTHIAMDVMLKLLRPAPSSGQFIQLTDWFGELKNVRAKFGGGTGPFPKGIFERVEASLPGLFAEDDRLMHGDFHHFNILSSERGWLVIDPKGVVGPAGYEIGPLMLNPWGSSMDGSQPKVHAKRRVNIIHERTGWARETIIEWALAHSVLSAWWDYPDGNYRHALQCAEVFSGIK